MSGSPSSHVSECLSRGQGTVADTEAGNERIPISVSCILGMAADHGFTRGPVGWHVAGGGEVVGPF